MTKTKILILVILITSACKHRQKSSELLYTQDSVLHKIQQGLSNMPILSRKDYITIDSVKRIPLNCYQIKKIQLLDETSIADNKIKAIDDLLDMELSLGISELIKVNKINNSFLPKGREYFLLANCIGLREKYASRKTNSVVNGFVIYKTDKEYYSYHLVDTVDFDLKIIGTYKNIEKIDLFYEIYKDSSKMSEHGLKFQNDTIIRYKIVDINKARNANNVYTK